MKEQKQVKTKKAKNRKMKDEGIRKRLNMSFMQVIVILECAAVLAVICLFGMSARYEHAMQYYGFSQGDIGKAMAVFAEARSSLRGAIGYDKQEEIDELVVVYEQKKAAFNTYMEDVEKSMVTDEGHAAYDAILETLDGYWELSDAILEEGSVADALKSASAQQKAFEELAPAYEEVYNALLNLMNVNVTKGDETHDMMSALKTIFIIAIIIIIAIAVMIALKIGAKIADGIEKPLKALGVRLEEFSHGDLDSPFPEVDGQDEIAVIIQDCKMMAENLHAIISDADSLMAEMANGNFAIRTEIEEKYEGEFNNLLMSMRKLNRQLDGTLSHINEATMQVTEGSGQLADSAQELAEGATEQAGAVEELTATVENVTDISVKSADNATIAATKAKNASLTANKSRSDMQDLLGAMERITATSKEIENIIVAIEDIASQTNLLSLNASIEAARAGEAGKGFAVVADQIGKLATDSAQSAVSTKELIVKALEEIGRGNQIVETTMVTIGEVLASMEEFAQMAAGSAEASQIQADMLKQIEKGIEQISVVVQSNSAASEETSAISEELSAHAISLREMISYFKLRNE